MTGFLAFLSWAIVLACALIFDSIVLFIIWCFITPIVLVTIVFSLF